MKKAKSQKQSIHHYCKSSTATFILANRSIRLSTPDNFNDPYDTKALFTKSDLQVASDAILNYFLDREMKTVIYGIYPKQKPFIKSVLFIPKLSLRLNDYNNRNNREYRPAVNYASLMHVFSRLGLKNGAEGSKSQESLEHIVELRNSGEINSRVSQIVDEISKHLLIACFSKKNDSILMWAHYADNNKGACIEFENEDFLDIQYSKKRSPLQLKKIMPKVLWNYHMGEKSKFSEKEEHKYLLSLIPLLTKSKDWEYEQEVRCILNDKNPKIVKDKNGHSYYHMKRIKSITLGCRITDADKFSLLTMAKELGISVYLMELDNNYFQLIKTKIL